MKERELNATESLELITRMIQTTRQQVEQSSHLPFLVWGYTTVITTLAVWCTYTMTHSNIAFWLWFAIPLLGWAAMLSIGKKDANKGYVRTPIDRILSHIWVVIGIAGLVATMASFMPPLPILFIIVLLMGSGSIISGLILQLRAITVAGCIGMALSLLFLLVQGINQCLIFAVIFMVMMVIPGHIMQYKHNKKQHNV